MFSLNIVVKIAKRYPEYFALVVQVSSFFYQNTFKSELEIFKNWIFFIYEFCHILNNEVFKICEFFSFVTIKIFCHNFDS